MRFAKLIPVTVSGGGAPWILGDDSIDRGPGSRFIVEGWPGFEQMCQTIPVIGAAYGKRMSWGNRTINFSLVCEYEFASENDCFLFVCEFPQRCPVYGTLIMGVCGGAQYAYSNTTIRRVVPVVGHSDPQVVSTRIRYDIEAGKPLS